MKVWNIEVATVNGIVIVQSFGRSMTEALINAEVTLSANGYTDKVVRVYPAYQEK